MKFIAYLTGEGAGCDYTIDCNSTMIRLKSNNLSDAQDELANIILGDWIEEAQDYEGGYYSPRISRATLFGVSIEKNIPVKDWYNETYERIKKAKEKAKEDEEIREYARLRAKYEGWRQ